MLTLLSRRPNQYLKDLVSVSFQLCLCGGCTQITYYQQFFDGAEFD